MALEKFANDVLIINAGEVFHPPKTSTGSSNERELNIPARRVPSRSPFHSRPIN